MINTYSIPENYKSQFLIYLIFFTFCTATLLISTFFYQFLYFIFIPVGAIGIFFIKHFLNAWLNRNYIISTTEIGISRFSDRSADVALEWKDICSIKENTQLQKLRLIDKHKTFIEIDYELSNINKLIKLISEETNIIHSSRLPETIKSDRITRVFLIFFACILLFAATRQQPFNLTISGFILILFSLFLIYLTLNAFTKVKITNTSIIIHFPFWKKKYLFSNIKLISLSVTNPGNHKNTLYVIIELACGKKINLGGIRSGAISLYQTILNAKGS